MTPEIKHRIGQIRRGEMPEGYNRVRDSIIPSDWKQYCLGELGENKNGLNFHREDKGIKIRILGVGDFGNLSVLRDLNALSEISMRFMPDDELLLKNGDIVFVRSNGSKELVGRNLLVYPQNEKVSFSGFCIRFRLSSDKITTAEYINLLLDNGVLKQKLQSENQGSNISNLNQSIIDNLQISIPCKGEQQKIVAILTTQDKVIKLKEKRLAEKQRQKKYLMHRFFVDANGKKIRLGQIANVIMGQSPSSTSYNEQMEGMPLIQGNGDIEGRNTHPRMYTTQPTKICKKGDILISVRAPVGSVSRSSMNACIGRGMCAVDAGIYQNYVYQYLIYFEDKWGKVSQGSTFESISGDEIRKLKTLIPDNMQHIEKILSTADREIELLQQDIEQEKQKKKALMQLLLTGIARVKT